MHSSANKDRWLYITVIRSCNECVILLSLIVREQTGYFYAESSLGCLFHQFGISVNTRSE